MNKALNWASNLVFPNRCAFCSGFIKWDALVCEECRQKLETASFCPFCGKSPCECSAGGISYDGCAVARPYAGTVRNGILELKYRCGFNAAEYLAPEVFNILAENGFLSGASLITAVPMTRSRRRETGYNQAEYIAKELSKLSGISCDFKVLGKRNSSRAQHELSADERRAEAFKAYFPLEKHSDITGKTVILCDDIITTGSTLSACAEALKSIGAAKVYCAVLAGTIKNGGI